MLLNTRFVPIFTYVNTGSAWTDTIHQFDISNGFFRLQDSLFSYYLHVASSGLSWATYDEDGIS